MLSGVEAFGVEFTFVGLGAILAGLGSALSGYAALRVASRGDEKDATKSNPPNGN